MNPLFKRLIKNSGYLFSSTGISAVVALVQGVLVTRLLGVQGFGVLGGIITFTNLTNNLVSFKMGEMIIKYVSHFSENGDEARAAAVFKLGALLEMGASILAYILLWLAAPYAALYLAKDPAFTQAFQWYGLIVLANLISESSTGLLQIFNRFRRIAIWTVVGSLTTLFLVGIVFIMGGDLHTIIFAYLIGKSLGAIGLMIAALQEAFKRWGRKWLSAPLTSLSGYSRSLARFAISTNISATISLATKESELLWVSLLRSPVEAGLYKLAITVSGVAQMPLQPLPQATYPELARQAARGEWKNFRQLLRRGSLLAGAFTVLSTGFLVLFGRWLISFFYTDEFLPSYPALVVLLVGYLAANTFYWRRTSLLALGDPSYPVRINLVLALVKLGLTFWLVAQYGYIASAFLLSAFYWITSAAMVLRTHALIKEHEQRQVQPA
jgi:O-antigen/teichoic acid export membrane protein